MHQHEMKEMDAYIHNVFGHYFISALFTVIEHSVSKHPKSEYTKKSMLEDFGLTEEEKIQKMLDDYVRQMEETKKEWDSRH